MKRLIYLFACILVFITSLIGINIHKVNADSNQIKLVCKMSGEVTVSDPTTLTFVLEDTKTSNNVTDVSFSLYSNIELLNISFNKCTVNNINDSFDVEYSKQNDINYSYNIRLSIDYNMYSNTYFETGNLCSMIFNIPQDTNEDDLRLRLSDIKMSSGVNVIEDRLIWETNNNLSEEIIKENSDDIVGPYNFIEDGIGLYFNKKNQISFQREISVEMYLLNCTENNIATIDFFIKSSHKLKNISYTLFGNSETYGYIVNDSDYEGKKVNDGLYEYAIVIAINGIESNINSYFGNGLFCLMNFSIQENYNDFLFYSSEELFYSNDDFIDIECNNKFSRIEENIGSSSNEIELNEIKIDESVVSIDNEQISCTLDDYSKDNVNIKIVPNRGSVEHVKVGEESVSITNGLYPIRLNDCGENTNVTIELIADDESIRKTYFLTIFRPKSNNSLLNNVSLRNYNDNDLKVKLLNKTGDEIALFNKNVFEYTIGYAKGIEKIKILPIVDDAHSSIYVGEKNVTLGEEIIIESFEKALEIKVVAQDESFSVYKFNLKELSNDADVLSISVKGILDNNSIASLGELTRDGNNFNLTFDNPKVRVFTIEKIVASKNATIDIEDNIYYFFQDITETGTISFKIISESGIEKEYNVNVTKKTSLNNFDMSIIVKGIEDNNIYSPLSNSTNKEYYYEFPKTINKVKVSVLSNDSALIIDGEGEYDLSTTNSVTILATNKDGNSVSIKLIFNAKQNEKYRLKNISFLDEINGNDIKDVYGNKFIFNENIYSYDLFVPNDVSNIYVSIEKYNEEALITGDGVKRLIIGNNTIRICVVNELNKNEKEYVINIVRESDQDDSTLSAIKINGMGIVGFSPLEIEYSITVSREIESINIECILTSETSTLYFENGDKTLVVNKNYFKIKVVSKSGVERIYSLTVNRIEQKNTITNIQIYKDKDTLLSSYSFNIGKFENELIVPYTQSSLIFVVEYDGEYGKIIGDKERILSEGINYLTIYVKSEEGISGNPYTFTITRERVNTNNYLSSIEVICNNKNLVEHFNKDINKYIIVVDAVSEGININAEAESEFSSIDGIGFISLRDNGEYITNGKIVIEIKVTSQKGDVRTYSLIIYKDGTTLSNENKITSIIVKGNDEKIYFNTYFNEDTYEYNINVPYSVSSVSVEAKSKGAIFGNDTYQLNANNTKVIEIYATSDSGLIGNTYRLRITRLAANENAFLQSIKVDNEEIKNFNKDKYSYTINYEYEKEKIVLEISTFNPFANVTIKQNNKIVVGSEIELYEGQNNINIKVVADNDVTITYSLIIYREYKLINLDSLTIDEGNLLDQNNNVIEFNPEIYEYYFKIPYERSSITLHPLISDDGFKIVIIGDTSLVVGVNETKIKVVSKNNTEIYRVYTIYVERDLKRTNEINIDNVEILGNTTLSKIFSSDVLEYSIEVTSNIDKITASISFEEKTDEAKPTYEIIGGDKLKFGENEVTLKITSPDGTISKSYNLKVNRKKVSLKNPKIDEIGEFAFEFNNDVNYYSYQVPSSVGMIHLSFDVDTKDTKYILSEDHLMVGKNNLTIDVYSKNEKVRTIYLTIYRTDAKMSSQITPIIIGSVVGGVSLICVITFIILKKKKDYEKKVKMINKRQNRDNTLKK